MLRRLPALCAAFVLVWSLTPSGLAAAANVSLEEVSFVPSTVEIRVGDSVTWTHNDSVEHTITAAANQEESFDFPQGCATLFGGCMRQGETFTHQFENVGTFSYYCRIHCRGGTCPASRMRGEVVVLPPATPTPTPRATPGSTTPSPVAGEEPDEMPESDDPDPAEPAPGPAAEPTPTPTPIPLPTFAPVPFTSPLALEIPVNESRETLLGVAAVAAATATLFGLLALWRFSPGYYRARGMRP